MSDSKILTPQEIDLIDCDQEPIHIPGSIQPHGLLFVLKEPELTILQVSNNTFNFIGLHGEQLINKNLDILFDSYHIEMIKMCLSKKDLKTKNPIKLSLKLEDRNLAFNAIIHRTDGVLILELELDRFVNNIYYSNSYDLVRAVISKIQTSSNLYELCQNMVKEVRQLTGFDRVMIYQFNSEGDGTVIAEDKQEILNPYLGLHYPNSDIPEQARKLYCLNLLRLIADVNYQPIKILQINNPLINSVVDLSFSVLRSVSPLHIEYLQNMGVRASMSISLIKDQKLWGLIVCHHQSPKYLSYEVRQACEFLGQVMSLEFSAKEDSEDYEYQLELKSLQSMFLESMSSEKNFIEGLVKSQPTLLDLVSAQGAVVYFEGNYSRVGEIPQEEELKHLIEWLEQSCSEEVFYTDSLPNIYREAEKFKNVASGLLAISISASQKNYILWFRPEVIQTVNWAGNPQKAIETADDGSWRLSPRKSFDLWQENVRLKSLPWKKCEVDAALGLRKAVINIVLRQADELAKLNTALQQSEARYREQATHLEKTLHELQYTQAQLIQNEKMSSLGQLVAGVAHEINNPINFIYANLDYANAYTKDLINLIYLYQQYYPSPIASIQTEIEAMQLEYLIEDLPKLLSSMMVGTERIREIVLSLRKFSRLDEAEMKSVDIHEGIDSTLMILQYRLETKHNHHVIQIIKEYGDLPLVECYAGQLNQVFMNLITNAIDALEEGVGDRVLGGRSEQDPIPTIKISTLVSQRQSPDGDRFASWVEVHITDNGLGILEDVQHRMFDPFFTTKPVGKGTGLGLAISHQIILEKHGGQLTCISALRQGAEFVIEIPMSQRSEGVGCRV